MTTNLNQHHKTVASQPAKWPAAVRLFHWISALLLLLTWIMITLHENTDGSYIEWHKSFGVSVLLWMVARVIVRVSSQAPAVMILPAWQKLISRVIHFGLYVLLFAMPLSGLLMSWYGGRTIDMFGMVEIPSMLTTDRAKARFFDDMHTEVVWPTLLTFTAVHLLAVLKHQFINKDKVMSRMK
ncbi:cytochrome b [Psychrobacter sp. FDAARGOS_221]|uniref:cytochrome b n=1 Tax=Psychrobacter sp. FDAARGOS_221 TaxID=1975705 RepID=UPI000BB5523E|nr:cytochrome b [Psychrobacter sp. FDAARGOS_221]PNK60999.1 cytochrome b [Psychrobacter sp. FDAARGOS_221]